MNTSFSKTTTKLRFLLLKKASGAGSLPSFAYLYLYSYLFIYSRDGKYISLLRISRAHLLINIFAEKMLTPFGLFSGERGLSLCDGHWLVHMEEVVVGDSFGWFCYRVFYQNRPSGRCKLISLPSWIIHLNYGWELNLDLIIVIIYSIIDLSRHSYQYLQLIIVIL